MVQETIDPKIPGVMETVLFTGLNVQMVNNSRPSDLKDIVRFVAADYGLNPCFAKQFKSIKRIIINCVKYN